MQLVCCSLTTQQNYFNSNLWLVFGAVQCSLEVRPVQQRDGWDRSIGDNVEQSLVNYHFNKFTVKFF